MNWWAVAVGVVADFMGSLGLGGVAIAGALMLGVPLDPNQPEPLWFLVSAMIGGFGATVLGGYISAAIARRQEIRHATAMGVVSLLLALPLMVLGASDTHPLWYDVLTVVLLVPFAALGGWLYLVVPGAQRPNGKESS